MRELLNQRGIGARLEERDDRAAFAIARELRGERRLHLQHDVGLQDGIAIADGGARRGVGLVGKERRGSRPALDHHLEPALLQATRDVWRECDTPFVRGCLLRHPDAHAVYDPEGRGN